MHLNMLIAPEKYKAPYNITIKGLYTVHTVNVYYIHSKLP